MKQTLKNIFLGISILGCFQGYGQLLDTYDISTSPNGVIPMPSGVGSNYSSFTKYTKIQAPNGQAIHFIAQNALTDAQIVRARNILTFYLTDLPGSQYGSDKSAVMNKMGTNNAVLMLLNGSDDGNPPEVDGQPLYQNEIAVEGHAWYTTNNYDHRDASFEEILHLMHDYGIGVDNNGMPSPYGALPDYQAEIRAAQDNADNNNFAIWPTGQTNWYNELANENSLSQEYLASVVDSYYGLWEPWTDGNGMTGMWGLYIAKTRAEIQTEDPMGYALMPKYFSPNININMDIDPSFTGIFNLTRTPSEPYTYKSQYLQHVTLMGSNASGIKGNHLDNNLNGNAANNTLEGVKGDDIIDGKAGEDIAIFTGARSEYTITNHTTHLIVNDLITNRDGMDKVINCETLQFTDQDVETEGILNLDELDNTLIDVYTNANTLHICLPQSMDNNNVLFLTDINGKQLHYGSYNTPSIDFNISTYPKGVYLLNILTKTGETFKQKFVIQ